MTDSITRFRGEYFFLSNFFRSEFVVPGLGRVRSAEHAYQALKTDSQGQSLVLQAESPGDAKRVGQALPLRADWAVGGRVAVMLHVLDAKFQIPELADQLYATGTARLVECNDHHDNFWGDCICGAPECAGRGTNMLGELLMVVRSTLEDLDEQENSLPSRSSTWNGMRDWLIESLEDQPVGLEIGLGPKGVSVQFDTAAVDLEELDEEFDDESSNSADTDPHGFVPTEAVCAQIYVLDGGTYLVRRSRRALRSVRFVDYQPTEVPRNVWLHDDPFGDCTDGYLYSDDHRLVSDAAVAWFRDNYDSPALADLACYYEFAEQLPTGDGSEINNAWR